MDLATNVHGDTQKPLIFIVDELDRCRPTYAVDFLEKIVHIFQVPNMVFVLGINKSELLNSLQSLYGNIDSQVYLRRFFQREFIMQPSNPTDFCRHLVVSSGLRKAFDDRDCMHLLNEFVTSFSAISGMMKLSLRDMEYCFRVIDLIAKNLNNRPVVHPLFLAVLIPLSLVNNSLYKRLIEGEKIGANVVNFLDEMRGQTTSDKSLERSLEIAEVYLYATYSNFDMDHNPAFQQLQLLSQEKNLTNPEFLSDRTKNSSPQRAESLTQIARRFLYSDYHDREFLKTVSSLIELVAR